MKYHHLFSEKDLQVLKLTYRTVLDNYYENASQDNIDQILLINNLIMQTISTREQSDQLLLVSVLEILKLKAKSNKVILESVQTTINHLKNPQKTALKSETLDEGLEKKDLFHICCLVLSRFYEDEMKFKTDTYDWKSIITKVSRNCDKNMISALEAAVVLLPDFTVYGKEVNKSGMVKCIFSIYLPQFLSDKINLYRSLKLLRLVAINDKSVLVGREKSMSLIICKCPDYIMMIQEIEELCFDRDFCLKILSNLKDIDPIFTWSYCPKFCELSSQSIIDELEKLLVETGKKESVEFEFKIIETINNFVKLKDLAIKETWKIPNYADKNLNSYLKLMISMVEKNIGLYFKKIDIQAIEIIYDKLKTADPVTEKLIKDIKNLDPSNNKSISKLTNLAMPHASINKNPDILMEGISKPPKNNKEFEAFEEVLNESQKNVDEFQLDTIISLKNKAMESLRKAITLNYNIGLWVIFNNLNQENYDAVLINKLLKLGELYLSKYPESADKFNPNKFINILDWLEDNQGIVIIDWVAAGQMISFLFGSEKWEEHIGEIPKRNFWLLNAYDSDLNEKLISQINSVPLNHPKLPLILGFISKSGDKTLKKMLFESKMVLHIINEVCNYKSANEIGNDSSGELMKKYLINVLNLSSYIFQWKETDISEQIQQRIISPCLNNIIKSFHGYDHEYRFFENCLPFEINVHQLKNVNVAKLLETHGKLTSYFHLKKYEAKIDGRKISSIFSETDPEKLEQILTFLEENPEMIKAKELFLLMEQLIKGAKQDEKYWRYFPNYMSILNHIVSISTKNPNQQVMDTLTDILLGIIGETAENKEIVPEELSELYETVYEGLECISVRKIRIDAKSLKIEAEKIEDEEWKTKIIEKLKEILDMMSNIPIPEGDTNNEVKYITTIPNKEVKTFEPNFCSKSEENILNEEKLDHKSEIIEQMTSSMIPFEPLKVEKQKKEENLFEEKIDVSEYIKNEEINVSLQNGEDKKLLDALKRLRAIIKKEESKECFGSLVKIFLGSDLNKNKRYILGHLLTEYYEIIEKDEVVLTLLKMGDKTNLNKEVCYQFLKTFEQAIVISKRWKLISHEFLDLAMERVQSTNSNKQVCIENGCEIAEYNIAESNDIGYFLDKKYHEIVNQLQERIEKGSEAMSYLLLIGSSSKRPEIKSYYIEHNLHTKIMEFVGRPEFASNPKIISNLSYALSSLVYNQNKISVVVASKKEEMLSLLNAFRKFSTNKQVVETGCSLLSNICYSNKESKELLFSYNISEVMIEIVSKNLENPSTSTFKQIMRTLGNLSLHKGCAEKLIDSHICAMAITMLEKIDILIYRDESKMKVLRLTVDLFSNLVSHKHGLELMHQEGLTNEILTLLETTETSEEQILMGCIDTIDGLCQNQIIETYVVKEKNLLMQLIDLLKVKEDEKLTTKSIRLLANMTLNQMCIPYILEANLLSVLANIVLSIHCNEKISSYVNKIIVRIFVRKPDVKAILKSGYIDCLMKAIDMNEVIDDSYIDIMMHYSEYIPNYLSQRAFFNLIKLLTTKHNHQDVVEKCLKVIRIIFSSEERHEEDIGIEGSSIMYEKLLQNNPTHKMDILYLIGLHCTKSKSFKNSLKKEVSEGKGNWIINQIISIPNTDEHAQLLGESLMFTILNKDRSLLDIREDISREEDFAYKLLSKGFHCKLYRIDGSYKSAFIDITELCVIRAYKYPDGEVKRKYFMGIRQLRDWQFFYDSNDEAWKLSVFNKERGMFSEKPKIDNCLTLLGSQQWGDFTFLNVEFNDLESKINFVKAMTAIIIVFKC